LSFEYSINSAILRCWRHKFEAKSVNFSMKRAVSFEELGLKLLKKELKDVQMERDILKNHWVSSLIVYPFTISGLNSIDKFFCILRINSIIEEYAVIYYSFKLYSML